MKILIFLLSLFLIVPTFENQNYRSYLLKFLPTIGLNFGYEKIKRCMTNGNRILNWATIAVNNIRTMQDDKIIAGISYLLTSIRNIVVKLKVCVRQNHQLMNLEALLQKANVSEIHKKILKNMGVYFHLATSAYSNFVDKKYDAAGVNVGLLTYYILYNASSTIYTDLEMIKNFSMGFSQGIGEPKNATKLLACVKENDQLIKAMNKSVVLIERTINKDVRDGCKILYNETRNLMTMLGSCTTNFEVFKKLDSKLRSSNPNEIALIMMRSIATYFHLALNAMEFFYNKDYKGAGSAIGIIHRYLFLGGI